MSSTEGTRPAAGQSARTWAGRNRAAEVSALFALGGAAFLGNFATGIAWLNPASSSPWPRCVR